MTLEGRGVGLPLPPGPEGECWPHSSRTTSCYLAAQGDTKGSAGVPHTAQGTSATSPGLLRGAGQWGLLRWVVQTQPAPTPKLPADLDTSHPS